MSQGLGELIDVKKEDDLTRLVIGSLELLGPNVINQVFDEVRFESPPSVRYDEEIEAGADRRIDAILESEEFVLAIESKLNASYGKSQLEEEYQDLTRYTDKPHHLYLITGHTSQPEDFDQVEIPEENLSWIGWDNITDALNRYNQEDVSHIETKVADLVTEKLRKEGYESFQRLKPVLGDSRDMGEEFDVAKEILSGHFSQFNTLRRKLDGQLAEEGLRPTDLFRDGASTSLNRFPKPFATISEHIWITYAESEAGVSGKKDSYLAVNFNTREKKILVGYQASTKGDNSVAGKISELSDPLQDFISDRGASLFRISYWGYLSGTVEEEEEIQRALNDEDWLEQEYWVMFGFEHPLDESVDIATLEEMAEELRLMNTFREEFFEPPQSRE